MLCDRAQELGLKDEFSDLVVLRCLVCLVVLPANHLFALLAADIADDVLASRHVSVACLAGRNVDDCIEKERFAMLTTEVLASTR